MTPIRQDLRAATHQLHERLQRHPVLLPLTSPGLTLRQYRNALAALYGFYAPVERRLPAAAAPVAAPRSPRAALLAADLADLADPAGCAAQTAELPDLTQIERALGARYVLDGAAHGGRVLLPDLARRLEVGPTRGARFYASAGIDTAAEWRALLALLAQRAARPDAHAAIVAGAVETFTLLERWLDTFNAQTGSDAQAGSEAA